MRLENYVPDSRLLAAKLGDLIPQAADVFPAAIRAIAEDLNGLSASKPEDYLDVMCPWQVLAGNPISAKPEARNRSVLVMSGCGFLVAAVMRMLGIADEVLWRKYAGYHPSEGHYGIISEIHSVATKAACLYTVDDLRRVGKSLVSCGDVFTADIGGQHEHVFTAVEDGLPVEHPDGSTYYDTLCLHGGRRDGHGRQSVELAPTKLIYRGGTLWYSGANGLLAVSKVINLALIPRLALARLPRGWAETLGQNGPENEPAAAAPILANLTGMAATMAAQSQGMVNRGAIEYTYGAQPVMAQTVLPDGSMMPGVQLHGGSIWSGARPPR